MLSELDEAGFRLARTAGHTPGAERAVRRFSALGEHAAVWLALGAAGAALDRPRRERWDEDGRPQKLRQVPRCASHVEHRRTRRNLLDDFRNRRIGLEERRVRICVNRIVLRLSVY